MILLLLISIIFLLISFSPYHYWDEYFYLFSVRYHSPGELLELEPELSTGIFPGGFFSAKLGFILILRGIVQAFGDGYWSLILIQSVFGLMMIGFMVASYMLFREIIDEEKEVLYITVVLIFLPISIYLGHKTLSEVPSLLFITLGCLEFLRSFRAHNTKQLYTRLLLSTLGLYVGVSCRFVSFLFFAGLILGLLVLRYTHYYWKSVLIRASLVSTICLLGLVLTWTATIGLPIDHFSNLVMSVVQRSPSLAVKFYSLAMSVQLFLIPLLLSIKSLYNRQNLLAFVWAGVCILPFVIASRYLEPRYFYMALVPLSILIHSGLQRLTEMLYLARYKIGKSLLLGVLVLVNWWYFAPLMPYEIDQRQYSKIIAKLTNVYQSPTYIIPWISDYSFLRFAFPEQQVKLSLSKQRSGYNEVFLTESFHHWVGRNSYVDSLQLLIPLSQPWIYVGWTYNPVVLELKKRLQLFGIDYMKNLGRNEKLLNHLTQSWVWSHPHLVLRPVAQVGSYYAFKVQISR